MGSTFFKLTFTKLLGVLLMLHLSPAALAVMPPSTYAEARNNAPIHALVEVESIKGPNGGLGKCLTKGTVTKVFRDKQKQLTIGKRIEFGISCYRRHAEKKIPVGGTLWQTYEQLKSETHIEVFLTKSVDPGLYYVQGDQAYPLKEPHSAPVCKSEYAGIRCK